ncbi:TD and POZ domain-containing protein 4 [Trichonephila inaurata madagascariensis]|uniref:TD and POZ domain-containing protein 4 n=1 Tax=Trichonephila inaurata madagascariensis TaxID=2747483 RepID=A0A8X7CSX5_9ARAC|nr:TD and POZ domain-containing protein 4 [Trichonephila inaurata madagascariensis]
MADDDARTAAFTFFWTIENCPILLSPKSIVSPIFYVDCLHHTKWRLEIKNVEQEYLLYFIHRDQDNGPYSVTIIFELSFIAADGSPISSERHQKQFVHGNFFEFNLPSDDVFRSRKSEFLSNDTLSLRCRMWEVKKDIKSKNLCFARTRLGLERLTIIWCVRGFSTLRPGEEVEYQVFLANARPSTLNMRLCVIVDSGEKHVVVKFLKCSDMNFLHFNCELSVLDITGKKHFAKKSRILLTACDRHMQLFRWEKLLEDKKLFLPYDVLCIRCEFEIGCGVVYNESEKYVRLTAVGPISERWRLI